MGEKIKNRLETDVTDILIRSFEIHEEKLGEINKKIAKLELELDGDNH